MKQDGRKSKRQTSWQSVKHAKLYSDLLQALRERCLDSFGFTEDRITFSISTVSHLWASIKKNKNMDLKIKWHGKTLISSLSTTINCRFFFFKLEHLIAVEPLFQHYPKSHTKVDLKEGSPHWG